MSKKESPTDDNLRDDLVNDLRDIELFIEEFSRKAEKLDALINKAKVAADFIRRYKGTCLQGLASDALVIFLEDYHQ